MRFKDRENSVKAGALNLLQMRGFMALRINSGAVATKGGYFIKLAPEGTPDILSCVPLSGRFLGVETKRAGGKARPAQLAFLDYLRRNGAVGLLVDDLEQLDAALTLLLQDPWVVLDEKGRKP